MDARKNLQLKKIQSILIRMAGRKCGQENHSSSLRQPNKYVCGVVMKLGNSFMCVSSKFSKNVLRFTVCAKMGKPKDTLLLGNSFQNSQRAPAISSLMLRPWNFFLLKVDYL